VHPAVPQELHARRLVRRVVDHDLGDVRVHRDVQVGPEPRRPQESSGGAAPGASPNGPLEK